MKKNPVSKNNLEPTKPARKLESRLRLKKKKKKKKQHKKKQHNPTKRDKTKE
ncbi:hypothetical protein ID0476_09200 [Helicobacter pylori]